MIRPSPHRRARSARTAIARIAARIAALGIFAVLGLGGCAAPEPPEPPAEPAESAAPFPTGIRVITETDATSDCIGDISTPLCALDTYKAAGARVDREMFKTVYSPHHYYYGGAFKLRKHLPSRYRIERLCYSTSEYNFYNYLDPSGSGVFKMYVYMAVEDPDVQEIYHTFIVNEAVGWQVIESTSLGGDRAECVTEPPPEWRPVVFE